MNVQTRVTLENNNMGLEGNSKKSFLIVSNRICIEMSVYISGSPGPLQGGQVTNTRTLKL
jgi:hypothetical protein